MVEMVESYIPGITNSLGFEPITPRSEQLPIIQHGRRIYHRRVDLYMHLAAMEARARADPAERFQLKSFMDNTQEWLDSLPRVGMADFDVRTPEELHARVSEFKHKGPFERIIPRTEYVPSLSVQPHGFIHVRKDVAVLVPAALLSLLTGTHLNVIEASYARSLQNMQDKCVSLLPGIKAKHADDYAKLVATLNIPDNVQDPDGFIIQRCAEEVTRYVNSWQYMWDQFDDKVGPGGMLDREWMLRLGYLSLLAGAVTASLVSGYSVARRLFGGLMEHIPALSRRRTEGCNLGMNE